MRKTSQNLTLLTTIFVTALITSNVVTSRLIATGIFIKGTEMILPGAMLCYAMTFLVTDIIGEIWGKKEANDCVRLGLFAQIMSMCLIQLTGLFPAPTEDIYHSYKIILGQNYIFVIASLCAYWCSQTWDVYIFHIIRNWCIKKWGNNKARWIWNNLSSFTSQMIDTLIFITIAFGVGYGWLFKKETLPTLGLMIIGQYLVKIILALLDTPFFYMFTEDKNE